MKRRHKKMGHHLEKLVKTLGPKNERVKMKSSVRGFKKRMNIANNNKEKQRKLEDQER